MLLAIAIAVLAYPIDARLLDQPGVEECFAVLLAGAGEGRRHDERAAFLVRREGGFECRQWPSRMEFRRASWSGAIPENTVAVVHTHPRELPEPSAHDADEASRIGAPIMVVTPGSVTMVRPGSERAEVLAIRMPPRDRRLRTVDETPLDRPPDAGQAHSLPDQRP